MTSNTEAFLQAHGIGVKPESLDRFLAEAVERLPKVPYRSDPRPDLTTEEIQILEQGGFSLTCGELGENDPLARTAVEFAAVIKTSLTEDGTAKRLGVEPREIRERLATKPPALYGVHMEEGWRIPEFQFDGNSLILGLDKVMAELDEELHPFSVYQWFTLPNPDLVAEARKDPISPREWLRLGFPVSEVVNLAKHL